MGRLLYPWGSSGFWVGLSLLLDLMLRHVLRLLTSLQFVHIAYVVPPFLSLRHLKVRGPWPFCYHTSYSVIFQEWKFCDYSLAGAVGAGQQWKTEKGREV
jgi:hypothetical protein